MASIVRNHLYTVDLNKPLIRESCGILLAEGDNGGDCFVFTLMRDGAALVPGNSCAVSAYFIRDDGSTVVFTGESTVHLASVTLPQSCYVAEGRFSLAVKVTMDGVTTTIAVLDGYIKSTQTDTLVDPGEVVPTLDELLAQIEAMEAATEAANTAAENAQEFIVTVTQPAYIIDGVTSGITANKTFAEIQAAITAGKTPVVRLKTSGQIPTQVLQLYMTTSTTIAFRQHAAAPSDYNVAGSTVCTFYSGGSITVSAVDFKVVPDGGTDGQVLVKKGESTYEWKDSGELAVVSELAPAIIPTASGSIVTISDSADRPLAGLRLYGKTTQDGTPTPDAPVELVNAGASGSIGVKACGANLLRRTDLQSGLQVAQPGDAAAIVDGYGWRTEVAVGSSGVVIGNTVALPCLRPGVTYTLSFVAWCTGTGKCYVDCYPDTLPETQITIGAVPTRYTWTFSSDHADMAGAKIRVWGSNIGSDVWTMCMVDLQLEVGSAASTFASYADGGSVTASTEGGLPGIPVSSGGNYTDSDGVMWLSDVRDYGSGMAMDNVLTVTLDGSNYPFAASNDAYWAELPAGYDAAYGVSTAISTHLSCSGYGISADSLVDDDAFMVYRHPQTAVLVCGVFVRMSRFATADALNAWLASNPITIMYPRRTPIETALTADEIAAYRAMTSHKPNTTVYNDGGAGMQVDYIADTKTYIDQRISALLNA